MQSAICNVLIVGMGGVGKTSLIRRLVEGYFTDAYVPTIYDAFQYTIQIENENVEFKIWDFSGTDDYELLLSNWIKKNDFFIICYAIDDPISFEFVEKFYNTIVSIKNSTKVPIIISGNKCDLEEKRSIPQSKGIELAARLSCRFVETSAFSDVNIKQPFVKFAKDIIKQNMKKKKKKFFNFSK